MLYRFMSIIGLTIVLSAIQLPAQQRESEVERRRQDRGDFGQRGGQQQAERFQSPQQGGRRGRGGPGGAERKLVDKFDANNDGWLNSTERAEARKFVKENPSAQRGPGRGGPGGGRPPGEMGPPNQRPPNDSGSSNGPPGRLGPPRERGDRNAEPPNGRQPRREAGRRRGRGGPRRPNREPAKPGIRVSPADVKNIDADLYDPSVLRTIFIDFENDDWESELQDFRSTDVDVTAKLTVDGRDYPDCGIHFRGMSSYFMVPAGHKRSLNISVDLAHDNQRLHGYKTLNLLNCSGDESMLSTVLYSHIANKHMPAPKANMVRVVINGENWGIYTNVQQFNKDFLREHYSSAKGTRWKVSGSPAGGGGLEYWGQDVKRYGHPFEMKKGSEKSLRKLIGLCQILEETPVDQLEAALNEVVDVDELLWFLALDNALCNSDGYWVRASDYSIYLDGESRFHFIPHDMNEAFRAAGSPRGPGGRRGMGGPPPGERFGQQGPPQGFGPPPGEGPPPGFGPPPGEGPPRGFGPPPQGSSRETARRQPGNAGPQTSDLDPLIGMDDARKPLRSKVLAVPNLRKKYLENVRTIADDLDWKTLGPVVAEVRALIAKEVKRDTRKLGSYDNFMATTSNRVQKPAQETGRRGHGAMNIRQFAQDRRKYLLKATDAQQAK